MNTATDFKGAVCTILRLIPGPTNPKCFLISVLVQSLCRFGSYFIKMSPATKLIFIFSFLTFFFLIQSIQQLNILYNLHSLQQERDKHLVLSRLHYVRDTEKQKNPKKQILQIWHINKSPAFQATEHKAMTFIINLGLFIYFNILAYSYSQCIFQRFKLSHSCHSFRRQHHNDP